VEPDAVPLYQKLLKEYKVETVSTDVTVKTAVQPKEKKAMKTTKKATEKKPLSAAKAKKPVGGKKKAAPTAKKPRGMPADILGKKITVTVKENPRREGSAKAKAFDLLMKNSGKITVEQFLDKGGAMASIKTAVSKNWIKLS
jgi:hypothetical protein